MSVMLSQERPQAAQARALVEDRLKQVIGRQEMAPIAQVKAAAARFLEHQGYDVLEYDWMSQDVSIDIVCRDPKDNTLVFVEVDTKTEMSAHCSVLHKDDSLLGEIMRTYLSEHNYADMPVRFDVVDVIAVATDRAILHHYVGRLVVA